MEIHGWGRYPTVNADIDEPVDALSLSQLLQVQDQQQPAIPRGAGRSYGDSALAERVISSRFLDHFVKFDDAAGEIVCASGVTLEQILQISVPKGWFLPVVPGTRFVTVGGAIASDVHGKNHHLDGCFSEFVKSIGVMLASGETVQCSHTRQKNLFRATCGGMGLTGVILQATLKLSRIESAFIKQTALPAANLDEIFTLFEENAHSKYSVAWLDCLAKGKNLGRSLLYLGEHATDNNLELQDSFSVSVPFHSPGFLLNKYSIGVFNSGYFNLNKRGNGDKQLHYENYFFPLDRIHHWNRLYGRKGFLQYQFVIPTETAKEGISSVLREVSNKGKGSFLTVLKKMGQQNKNFLSFPLDGYTLALDFKYEQSLLPLLDRLDEIVLAHDGKFYLAKDARMNEQTFKQAYPEWEKFMKVRNQVDPDDRFTSLQARRLGLVSAPNGDRHVQ
ncbi:MAG: FAD-binding oxidoreductase [Gammaproteobacteria bacterium]|nr:FAD-binding oxidoreductase [Gammaproteobacteria bacterium]